MGHNVFLEEKFTEVGTNITSAPIRKQTLRSSPLLFNYNEKSIPEKASLAPITKQMLSYTCPEYPENILKFGASKQGGKKRKVVYTVFLPKEVLELCFQIKNSPNNEGTVENSMLRISPKSLFSKKFRKH